MGDIPMWMPRSQWLEIFYQRDGEHCSYDAWSMRAGAGHPYQCPLCAVVSGDRRNTLS